MVGFGLIGCVWVGGLFGALVWGFDDGERRKERWKE